MDQNTCFKGVFPWLMLTV